MSDSAQGIESTTDSSSPPEHRPRSHLRLFVVSFVLLFAELACIRWFGSTVVFLTFFTNIVLMACVLGMSVGCLAASRDRDLINSVIPLTLAAVMLAAGVLAAYERHEMSVEVGNQNSPQEVFFGAESAKQPRVRDRTAPIDVVAGVFFALIALSFAGLGQELGRSFDRLPNRVAAYTTNVAGSLAGIAAFAAASWFRTSPRLWFAVAFVPVLGLVTRRRWLQALALLPLLFLVEWSPSPLEARERQVTWSPYYKVVYTPGTGLIETNNIGHQQMLNLGGSGPAYVLPHLLNRDAGRPPFDDVLIIGAGSGNDVQAALSHGAKHVDAVEIDPVMYEIGRAAHPQHPYQDPRVTIHLDDGRSVLRRSKRHYDLILYALVDSLVLHSGYSSLRLENFLFTEQALRDAKARLKPDGVFVIYNYYRQGWVVGRLKRMAETVFGVDPIIISLPYRAKIKPEQNQAGSITMLIVGKSEAAVAAVRQKLKADGAFWSYVSPRYNEAINAYGPAAPSVKDTMVEYWRKIALSDVEVRPDDRWPTDDWPFLYLRGRTIPFLNIRGMLVMAAISLVLLQRFAPVRVTKPNGRMFFLGAGFMLLETKGVVHLALLFGSTWVVNSVVFAAVLVMVLLSNLYVAAIKPRRVGIYYVLLVAALLVNAILPTSTFLALPGAAKVLASCAVVFVPIFFAGVIFATAFRDSRRPDVDFGSNIGGVILGGLSENLSLVVGFDHLIYVAIGFYLLSAVFARRRVVATA